MTIDRNTIAGIASRESLESSFSGAAMVNLYNFCVGADYLDRSLVKRFSDKNTAVRRTWTVICEVNEKFPLSVKDIRPEGEPLDSEPKTHEEIQEVVKAVSESIEAESSIPVPSEVRGISPQICTLGQEKSKKLPRPIKKQHSPFEHKRITPFREGSKFGQMVEAMLQPGGCTMQVLYDICASRGCSWPMPTVRAAILDFIFNRGYNVRSEVRDGEFFAICEIPEGSK